MTQKKKVLLSGSIAFDVIFSIPVDFRKSIPLEAGKIRSFNATYIANDKEVHLGGTAGNIAVWMAEAKTPSEITIHSGWGRDLMVKNYYQKLTELDIELRGTEGEFTACAYTVSDPLHQQLIIWQPNAYENFYESSLADVFEDAELAAYDFAIFSAGNPDSILRHMAEFRAANDQALVVFDPGQITPFFEPENFKKVVEMADVLIGNDIEFQHFDTYFDGALPSDLIVIETLGDRGAKLFRDGKTMEFPALKVDKIVETTGAGDAFRAGLLKILCEGGSWEEAMGKGCEFGAQCVELPSAQS